MIAKISILIGIVTLVVSVGILAWLTWYDDKN